MAFYYGGYDWDSILATIRDDLASYSDCWEIYDDEVPNGICLKDLRTNRYLCLRKRTVWSWNPSYNTRDAGIQACLSTEWDINNHVPAGSVKSVFGTLYSAYYTDISYANDYLNNYMGSDDPYTIAMWTDKAGFVLAVINPCSYDPATTVDWTCGFFMNVEFIPDDKKEFDDGMGNLYLIATTADMGTTPYENAGLDYKHNFARDVYYESGQSLGYCRHERYAIRSLGSGKVYFEFPYYYNEWQHKTLSAQTKRWFLVQKDMGIAVGDIISWIDPDAGVTRKFFVAHVAATGSGASSANFLVAIPYQNADDYS